MRTDGERPEHVRKGIGEFLVALVHFQIHLAQVRRTVHADFDERPAATAAAGFVRFVVVALLTGHDVLPERSDGRPAHHLCPESI